MADRDPRYKKQRRLGPEAALPSPIAPNQANPSKFDSHFLYRALAVAIFIVILPLFPSEAPEFVNQTIPTRWWELLHLLFVGIAVSYGLFSRRNDETDKDNPSILDSTQSYVSRLLQVSSVFDDEAETPSGSDDNKVQTWSSQYYREEPAVMVAHESPFFYERRGLGAGIHEKPPLFPVLSLKSRVFGTDVETVNHEKSPSSIEGQFSRPSSSAGLNRFSNSSARTRNEVLGGSVRLGSEEDNVVLRSPIPWRSRSGRMEVKEEVDSPPLYLLPPSMEDVELSRSEAMFVESQIFCSSPKKLSPSPSLSSAKRLPASPLQPSEIQAKSVEDMSRKGIEYKMSSPPPAPPPPPPIIQKTQPVNTNSRFSNNSMYPEKELRRCFTDEHRNSSRSGEQEPLRRANSEKESKPRPQADRLLVGRSVRTVRSEPLDGARRAREMDEDATNFESSFSAVESNQVMHMGRKMMGFDEVSVSPDKRNFRMSNLPEHAFSGFEDEDSRHADKLALCSKISDSQEGGLKELDDNSNLAFKEDCEDEDKRTRNGEAPSMTSDGGPDVDKKADEFIAKFREQIRLQRVESIKRSSKPLSGKSHS